MQYLVKVTKDPKVIYVRLPFEEYYLDFPEGQTFPEITGSNFDHFTFVDGETSYKFYDANEAEVELTPSQALLDECAACLALFHTTFDADALERAKSRVTYHLDMTFPFKDYYCTALYFQSSLGFKAKGDAYTKDALRDTLDLMEEDETTTVTDYDGVEHELTYAQLKKLITELTKNKKAVEQQRVAYLEKINNSTTVEELNELHASDFPYVMKDFTAK